ncbi:MAG: polymer-forming cytoskeletal protein [Sphingomonas sp.]|nr:polymer-forming cytoskeletal protein [Sphingomonas sp.]
MFNNNSRGKEAGTTSQQSASGSAQGKRGMFSVLGQDVVITGNIRATADLHIEGCVDGDVDCGALVQGAESRITGNVRAENARLTGSIEGCVIVRQLVIERAARINGDVEYESISIENGATINGHLRHKSAGTLSVAEPATLTATKVEPLLLKSGAPA